jgi:hypothetical protein
MGSYDRLTLWGAVAIMVAVGSLFFYKVSESPTIDPEIAALKAEHQKLMNGPARQPAPGQVPTVHLGFVDVVAEPKPGNDFASTLRTKFVGVGVPRRKMPVDVLSLAVPKTVVSTLDATTLTWSVVKPEVDLPDWVEKRIDVLPTGFLIQRMGEDGKIEPIGEAGAKALSYTDLTCKPRTTYRYWVVAKGKESDLTMYPGPKKDVEKGLDTSVQARTPSDTRAKLVGGDKGNAFVKIETYDRVSKKWGGKTSMAAPGQKIGTSGWVLKGLRFDNFTLVADVTDDQGVDRVLSTKD